ncbi:MAG: DUF2442 domain-containing protein [Betaproteobacteria bacterium]
MAGEDYSVWLLFDDGVTGVVCLRNLVDLDRNAFRAVRVDDLAGSLAWPAGIRLDAELLYNDIKTRWRSRPRGSCVSGPATARPRGSASRVRCCSTASAWNALARRGSSWSDGMLFGEAEPLAKFSDEKQRWSGRDTAHTFAAVLWRPDPA